MGTVVALFRDYDDAARAIDNLEDRGFTRSEVSVVAREATVRDRVAAGNGDYDYDDDAAEGAAEGAAMGGLAGLLVGLGALALPGVGPLFVAGAAASVVTSTLAGATAGAVTGGLLGALTDMDIPEEEAAYYAEGVKRGGVLVAVQTDREAEARDVLRSADPVDIESTVAEWRSSGWTGYERTTEVGPNHPRL
jgi:hypothetical protein